MKSRIKTPHIAYFSMEIALDPNMPTYSGGLGMLAGDTLRSAADLSLSMFRRDLQFAVSFPEFTSALGLHLFQLWLIRAGYW